MSHHTYDLLDPVTNDRFPKKSSRWAVVLAGGCGERMQPLIESWLGEERPKQFCTFTGTRSMLQHTIDRALHAVLPQQIVTVIGTGQRDFLVESLDYDLPGPVLEQPSDRGSAAGVFLALSYVLEQDPGATVLLLAADQFVYPEAKFIRYLQQAFVLAESFDQQLVLLGAAPDRAETDYGWIKPGEPAIPSVWGSFRQSPLRVSGFIEKPDAAEAEQLLRGGALWNTLNCAVKAQSLWKLGQQHLPALARVFQEYRLLLQLGALRGRCELGWIDLHVAAMRRTYAKLTAADFSNDLLSQLQPGNALVLPAVDIEWSDWGRPERLREVLERYGLGHCDVLRTILRSWEEAGAELFLELPESRLN